MIDRNHDLSLSRQAKILNVSRGSVYYKPWPVSAEDLKIMRRLDELHLDYPFAGSRMLRDLLKREGVSIGRRHVATLMKRMGIEAIYRRPNTSKPAPGHKVYPYLLRGKKIERADHVWAMDITYIPMARGFVYLAAVVDVFSRRVLSHRLSITMEAEFCVEALREALAKHGKPEIFNTDQGSQFTSIDFTGVLLEHGVAISMDGKGAWRDNVFVERLWRSVKYEEVYLCAYDSVSEARASIARYLAFYNERRPHSSLDRRTPDEAYLGRRQSRRRHETVATIFDAASGRATPSRRCIKIARPRVQHNPADPLNFRGALFKQPESKRRSLKSSAPRPSTVDDVDKNDPKPSFLDPSVFATRRNNPDDKYKAALKVADAVFGGGNLVVAVPGKVHHPTFLRVGCCRVSSKKTML